MQGIGSQVASLTESAVQTFPEVLVVFYFAFQEWRGQAEDVIAFTTEITAEEIFLIAECTTKVTQFFVE